MSLLKKIHLAITNNLTVLFLFCLFFKEDISSRQAFTYTLQNKAAFLFDVQSTWALEGTVRANGSVVASIAVYPVACEEIFRIVGACRRRMSQWCGW